MSLSGAGCTEGWGPHITLPLSLPRQSQGKAVVKLPWQIGRGGNRRPCGALQAV